MESVKYIFKKELADRAVNWIERYCTHVKGEWAGRPLRLEKWQKEQVIRPLFGWVNKQTGLRRYRRSLIFIPRKNGKSTLGAAIALYLLSADNESGAEIYSAAADREQARLIHSIAKGMIDNNPELKRNFKLYQNSINFPETGSYYHVLSADVANKHGKNAHGIIFDELHTQPNRELWDVLTTSIGSRRQPLIIAFTTAGFDKQSICYEQYEYAKKVRDGIIQDDEFLPVIFETDAEANILTEETWKQANPNYGKSLKVEYIQSEAIRAINEPTYENAFRRLQLNQWTTSETKWIPDDIWMKCAGEITDEDLKGLPCYAGLDLASTRDICAFVMIFPLEDKRYLVKPYFFIPEYSAKERTKKDGVNYDAWVRAGLMIETPGNVTDYDYIRKKVNELSEQFDIRTIGFDRFNASQLVINLQQDGFKCEPFGQGYGSMSAPTKELERLVYQKQILHGGNEVLRWMCSNVLIEMNPAADIKISKAKSTEKVDGMVGLVMALGQAMNADQVEEFTGEILMI